MILHWSSLIGNPRIPTLHLVDDVPNVFVLLPTTIKFQSHHISTFKPHPDDQTYKSEVTLV